MNIVKVGDYEVGQGHPLLLMAGPCVLEGYTIPSWVSRLFLCQFTLSIMEP